MSLSTLPPHQQLALKRRKLELMQRNPLLFYTPHAKQYQFHMAAEFKFRYYRAGNRSGKSEGGVAEDCAFALGERPWMRRDFNVYNGKREIVHRHTGSLTSARLGIPQKANNIKVVSTDWKKVRDVLTGDRYKRDGKFFHWLPKDSYEEAGIRTNSEGVIDRIHLKNGSLIQFYPIKAFTQNALGAESDDYTAVHYDEPPPHDLFKADLRGLTDEDGKVWFTLTPLTEPWINDTFVPSRKMLKDLQESAVLMNGRKYMIVGSIHDNPFLTEAGKNSFLDELSHDERQCREHGVPLASSGLVYKEFNYDRHVLTGVPKGWDAYDDPPKNYTIYVAIDPHPQTPHAVLFIAVSPQEQKFVFDEVFEHIMIPQLAYQINERLMGRYCHTILLDPLAYIEDAITGDSMAEALLREGVVCQKAVKDLSNGILTTKAALKGKNNFYFSPNLVETMYEFDHYMWDPKHPNKPIDKSDHMMENLYRLNLNGLQYIAPPEEQERGYAPMTFGRLGDNDLNDFSDFKLNDLLGDGPSGFDSWNNHEV